ncbi:ribosome biogenesis GTP-binding protein YihA/YsxC [Aquicella lusitana]|uniref:Probable GTP-binding protein EngB n=1 Tax=Aquicella lusitana TaxID=254246 RepID=A0A370G8I7_9COXI|nr:ribosome biogenesis GTP-binding protein YihA/YsxC [Aquicella lusitana]RDI40077.1 cell division checkpoint GTPase YihA [Aquicella lusitana]VVC72357.1 putative GTP-binding protein EngB [Aquicella lusitana]
MSSHYQKAYFLLSVADVKQLPPDEGIEVAMVGRSNAGKSSVLNRITQSKGLARVSKTPGRTQHVNVFVLDERRRLTDLPGYGYARVPVAAKEQWQKTVDAYIRTRGSLRGIILVMDIRHPLKELDLQLLEYCDRYNLPVHILLNKADKLSKGAVAKTFQSVKAALTRYHNSVTLQSFSALKGKGIDELHSVLDAWYDYK